MEGVFMSKYIIEIDDDHYANRFEGHILFKAKNFNSLVFDKNGLDKLTKFEDAERAAYGRGYQKAENDYYENTQKDRESANECGYQDGLKDAWNLARKICLSKEYGGLGIDKIEEIFDGMDYDGVLGMELQDVKEIIYKYENEESDFRIGDEVSMGGDILGVVTRPMVNKDKSMCHIMCNDGSTGTFQTEELSKTGRHFDLPYIKV